MDYPNFEIVIIDNGSTDGSVEAFNKQLPAIRIIETGKNLGYAGGQNVGLRDAFSRLTEADFVMVINNDTKVDKNCLAELVKTAQKDPKIGLVSGKVYFWDKPKVFQTAGKYFDRKNFDLASFELNKRDVGQLDQERELEFTDDVFALFSKKCWQKTKGYSLDYFLYYEEADLMIRIRRAGLKIYFNPKAKIWHKASASTGGGHGINPRNLYLITKNRLVFFYKFYRKDFKEFAKRYYSDFLRHEMIFLRSGRANLAWSYFKGVLAATLWLIIKSGYLFKNG